MINKGFVIGYSTYATNYSFKLERVRGERNRRNIRNKMKRAARNELLHGKKFEIDSEGHLVPKASTAKNNEITKSNE